MSESFRMLRMQSEWVNYSFGACVKTRLDATLHLHCSPSMDLTTHFLIFKH
jgi:hypothetical protein